MRLYGYFRSSAAYRVRIALNLKGLDAESNPVHLGRGDHLRPEHAARSPQKFVPVLEVDGHRLVQSLAICEYLDETHPQPPLLPADPLGRARVRALAQVVACDIHPLNNQRVLKYLTGPLHHSESERDRWYCHWIDEGLAAIERMLADDPATGRFCHGDAPTLADVCLVPQVFNAGRYGCDTGPFPTVRRIVAACADLDAFRAAAPENQPDAE